MNVHTHYGGKLFAVVAFAAGVLATAWLLPFLVLLPFVTVRLGLGYAMVTVWVVIGTFQTTFLAALSSGAIYAVLAAHWRRRRYRLALLALLLSVGACAAVWALTEPTEYLEAMEEPSFRNVWTLYFFATSPLQAYVAQRWSRRWLAPTASEKVAALPTVSSQRDAPET